jgi:REP element-mobilizing transposase RayT
VWNFFPNRILIGKKKMQFKITKKNRRLARWDYGSNAIYLVSICTQKCAPYLGVVVVSQNIATLQKTEIGKCAKFCIHEIPHHYDFVEIVQYEILPNIIYLILKINKPVKDNSWNIGKFGPQSMNLGAIVRGFKIGVTKFAIQNRIDFCWQRRFFDRIIRNESELSLIKKFIAAQKKLALTNNFFPKNLNELIQNQLK